MKNGKYIAIIYAMALGVLVEVPFIQRFPIVSIITTILQLALSALLFFKLIHNGKLSRYNIILLLFLLIYIFSTIVSSGDVSGVVAEAIHIVSISLLIEFGIKNNKRSLASGALAFYATICAVNLITLLVFPEGLYETTNLQYTTNNNWLLGYKNGHILYSLQFIMWGGIYEIIKKRTIGKIALFSTIFSLFMAALASSTTSVVSVAIVLLLELLIIAKKKTKIVNIVSFLIIYIISYVSIIFFRIQEEYDSYIYNLTAKHSDFVGRSYIWDSVLRFIERKPLLGYGREDTLIRQNKTVIWKAAHAHNGLLEIIYRTGVIGSVVFLLLIGSSFSQLRKHKNEQISKFLVVITAAMGIMTITEYFGIQFLIPLFTVIYNVGYFRNDKE